MGASCPCRHQGGDCVFNISLGFWSRAACLAAAIGLGGCQGLAKVSYDKPAVVTSTRSAEVRLVSGEISGEAFRPAFIWPIPVPIPQSPSSAIRFNLDDQRTFVSSLVGELNRLMILKAVEAVEVTTSRPDVSIQITFLRTEEQSLGTIYELEVELAITSSAGSATKRYTIASSEGESNIQRLFTRPADAKERAAIKLLAAVIPDIEKFLLRK
jgi:hypothetical protein